jgi:hypothetical protein
MSIPLRFERMTTFSEGLAPVLIHGEWGYIDRIGAIVIPPRFRDARIFSEGLAAVQVSSSQYDKWGFIDKTGKIVIKPRYEQAGNFRGGLVKVYLSASPTLKGREQYLDRTGNLIWDFEGN